MTTTGSVRRRTSSPEQRRAELLVVGAELLAERGYDGVRLKDVAKAAGVSIGLLQHYFDSRDALLEEAFRKATGDLLAEWQQAEARDLSPWELVEFLVGRVADSASSRTGSVLWSELAAAASRHEQLRPIFTDVYAVWTRLFRSAVDRGVAAGAFHPRVPVEQAVSILLAHSDGCEFAVAVPLPEMSAESLRNNSLTLAALLLGLDGPTGPERSAR